MLGKLSISGWRIEKACDAATPAKAARNRAVALFETLEGRAPFAATPLATPLDLPQTGQPADAAAAVVAQTNRPQVTAVSPAAGTKNVSVDAFVSAEVSAPNGGVDASSLTADAVYLYRVSDNARVPATANTSGGGDVIVLKPKAALAPNTAYAFAVTAGVRDVTGASFAAFTHTFTTGAAAVASDSPVHFDQLPQATTAGRNYFGLKMGPDNRLYAAADDGNLYRFDVAADGSLGTPFVIDTIARNNNGARFVVGIAFHHSSTPENVVVYVSHSGTSSLDLGGKAGENFTGKISVLTGENLSQYRDAVVRLPRSVRDHVTNQLAFGPDKALYFCQPSQSAMGAADVVWGNRAETLLTAAVLRLDVNALGAGTVDALTVDVGGTYDPRAAGAPLTIYADGVRNAFDLVFHSNGSLYAPANGSAAGGNTPAGKGAPGLTGVSTAETDYLFRVTRGGYYGHPNPAHGKFVLNGGNPTAGVDPYEVVDYPVGTNPDGAWKQAAFDFGAHQSPNGVIEFRGSQFGGALNGKLLVARYSGGDDIIALTVAADGRVTKSETNLKGLGGLADPVDLTQDRRTGHLYVIELGARRITLLRPHGEATVPPVSPPPATVPPTVPPPVPVPQPAPQPSPEPKNIPATPPPNMPAPVPAPVPVVPPAGRADQKLLAKIERFCQKAGIELPAVQDLRGRELKDADKTIRKLCKTAVKRMVALPDLSGMSVADLKSLLATLSAKPAGTAGRM